jgi:thiol:disulfide interchange protein DsbG
MNRKHYWGISLAAIAAAVTGLYLMNNGGAEAVAATSDGSAGYPAPIAALQDRGMEILQRFDAPGEMVAFAAKAGPRPVAAYVTPDGEHAIIGTMLDAEGNEVTSQALEPIIQEGRRAAQKDAWPRLERGHWVPDGSADADRVLYVFTDPNCPYCHKLWQRTRDAVAAGDVQLRHIMVGILKPSSPGKAAAILGADKPGDMFTRNEQRFESGGVEPVSAIPSAIQKQLTANRDLMRSLGIRGTPAVFYRDAGGDIRSVRGMPRGNRLSAMLGGQYGDAHDLQ